jgi:hypothetical protein
MRTANAIHSLRDRTDRFLKPFWDCDFFTGEREKRRQYGTGVVFVFA